MEYFGIHFTSVKTIQHLIVNWNKNRQPDPIRINEIKEYYISNNLTLIPGLVSAWKRPLDPYTFEVYDGIHRILAAADQKSDMKCLFKITETNDENVIINDFNNINKSVSVPFIYLEQGNDIKRRVCENVANFLSAKFPAHVSASRRCTKNNFNRDNVIEFTSQLEIDFVPNVDVEIQYILLHLNSRAKEHVQKNKILVPKKCYNNNFFLFYLNGDYIKNHVETVLKKS